MADLPSQAWLAAVADRAAGIIEQEFPDSAGADLRGYLRSVLIMELALARAIQDMPEDGETVQ